MAPTDDPVGDPFVEAHLVPPHLDELAGAEGREALRVPAELELRGKSPARRVVETVASFSVVVVLFAFALPKVTGAEYGVVWDTLGTLMAWQVLVVTVVWLATMWSYTGVMVASLPGLRHTQALVLNFSGSALANVVPFGGAVGVGVTYAMGRSWGFGIPSITRSIVVSGFWNVFAKLAIPLSALALLAFSGKASGELVLAAVVGVAVLVVMVVVFALVLRSDALARSVGVLGERIASTATRLVRKPPVTGLGDRLVAFRHDSVDLLRRNWLALTFWMFVYTIGQFAILLLCVRYLGTGNDSAGWIEVYAAFAFNRLLTTIPLTPSGVGIAETGTVALLTAFGAATNPATAAVLLYSTFTYLLEIPLGALGWGVWATRKSWRRPVGERPIG